MNAFIIIQNQFTMKANPIIQVCGSIIKKESITSIDSHIIVNTCVAEANLPYSLYYGNRPEKSKPNSIFLFTKRFYSLEEVLRVTQNIDSCLVKNLNVASAVFNFKDGQVPAIRIKNFSEYRHLGELQNCFMKFKVEFEKKFPLANEAYIRINKCFVLEEIANGIFLDKLEDNKGYIALPHLINYDEFQTIIQNIRNNSACGIFDVAKASIIINSGLTDIIRIYSEKMDINLLHCIKEELEKIILQEPRVTYFNIF